MIAATIAPMVAARLGRGTVTVVSDTTNTDRVVAFQALLPASRTGLRQDSKAQPEQIRTVAVERLGPTPGQVPPGLMAQLDDALSLRLGL